MKKCQEIQGYLLDRVLGEIIPPAIEVELRDHLSLCPGCRKQFEESEAAWKSLDVLKGVRFPESLSQNVLREVAAAPRAVRFTRRPYVFWRVLVPIAASLLIAVGIYFISHGYFSGDRTDQSEVIREASTFVPGEVPRPDLRVTMDSYLNETRNILYGIQEGSYSDWGSILSEIISRDIQGQANFLLENPDLPPSARPIIGVLHDAFQQMLRSGRGHESKEVYLPPGINPEALLAEIEQARYEVRVVQ
jgi:hypothetical protein